MRSLLILAVIALTGCTSIDTLSVKKYYLGYRQYDPCIRCGEKFTQLPNWEHEAIIRTARCASGIDTENNCY
jgi:hypothetical protein